LGKKRKEKGTYKSRLGAKNIKDMELEKKARNSKPKVSLIEEGIP
jgi:hypothetical protein